MLEQYPDRVAARCTHAYFDTDLTLLADGRLLKEEIVQSIPTYTWCFPATATT